MLSLLTFYALSLHTPLLQRLNSNIVVSALSTSIPIRHRSNLLQSSYSMMSGSTSSTNTDALSVDPFAYRQFAEKDESVNYKGNVFSISIAEFTKIANERYDDSKLVDGYAPFCKHIFIKNDFTDATVNVLRITPENEHLLRCTYEARNEKELPVLTRHFPKELVNSSSSTNNKVELPIANYLDLILYSREQIKKENAAMEKDCGSEASWGIVSIKAQDVDYELPMTPITIMRNALGKDEGGSGVKLDREAYMKAFNIWKDYAVIS